MKSIKIAAFSVVVWVGLTGMAAAQTAPMQPRFVVDSLDPLLKAVPSMAATLPTAPLLPAIGMPLPPVGTTTLPILYIASRTDEGASDPVSAKKTVNWDGVVRGIETGLDLTHQALDVVDHYQDVKARARYYRRR